MKLGRTQFLLLGMLTAAATATTAKLLEPRVVSPPGSFSMDMTTEIYDLAGELHAVLPSHIAYHENGSRVRIDNFIMSDGSVVERRRIYDLDGSYKFVTFGESVSSYTLTPERVKTLRNEQFRCGNVFSTRDRLLGFDVVLEVEDYSEHFPDMKSATRRSWLAPELGCSELQVEVSVEDENGIERFTNRLYATNVTIGTPDPSLFGVPEHYVERPPSGAIHEVHGLHPQDVPIEGAEEFLWRLDEAYWTNWLGP